MTLSRITIGICAYNEENNIGRLLENLVLEQNLPEDCRILVVCSGCIDRTPKIVKEFHGKDSRIEPIIESMRKGKANALNKIFRIARKSADALVLVNADAMPERESITKLVSELAKSNAGAVFAMPVPFKESDGLCQKIVHVIWRLHHTVSLLGKPKLSGELCAIRGSCLREIPEDAATDEPYIELAIRQQGYDVLYVPGAIVNIRCPTNIVDLFKHRKRILTGHMHLEDATGFKVSTSSFRNVLAAIPTLKLSEILYVFLGGLLEIVAYFQARVTLNKGRIPYIWDPIKSTKTPI